MKQFQLNKRLVSNSMMAKAWLSVLCCSTWVFSAQAQVSETPNADPMPSAESMPSADPTPGAGSTSTAKSPPPVANPQAVDLGEDSEASSAAPVSAAPIASAPAPVASSAASAPAPELEVDDSSLPWTFHQRRFDLGVGVRLHWVTDSDFELFSEDDLLPLLNIRAGGTVWAHERWSLALLGEWDYGASSGNARGVGTEMHFHRFQGGGEMRYHVTSRFAPFGRLSGGAARFSSRVGEENAVTTLYQNGYQFTGGLNVGAAFRVLGSPDGRKRAPRIHLIFEAGYALNSAVKLDYEVSEDGPLRPEGLDLGSLSMNGPQLTFGLVGSF